MTLEYIKQAINNRLLHRFQNKNTTTTTKQRKWREDIKYTLQQHGLIMVKDHNTQMQ
jgi:hypothetical protein